MMAPEMREKENIINYDLDLRIYRMLQDEPFFARLSRQLAKRPNKNIPTAGVRFNPESEMFEIQYNPKFMSELEEIDVAVNTIMKYGKNPVVMHCNSTYPAPHEELNMSLIPFYMERYDCPIGYSGHEKDMEPTVIAATLGAKIIERHITLDHNMWGTDQKASLEVLAMDMLYKRIRNIKKIRGEPIKTVTEGEIPIRKKFRKV